MNASAKAIIRRKDVRELIRQGKRVVCPNLIDIRLNANLSRAHVARLSGIHFTNLQAWERDCYSVPAEVVQLYKFYAACSRTFGKDFYLERTEPVMNPTILAWVKSKGEKLSTRTFKLPWRQVLSLLREKAKRHSELLEQGIKPEESVPFRVQIPRRVFAQMQAEAEYSRWLAHQESVKYIPDIEGD